jgi:transcriptional regulator with XRE-family HTH domain
LATIGTRLKEERTRLKLNQTQFGRFGYITKASQINYESDLRSPDANYLAALASHGVDVNYILTGTKVNAPIVDWSKTYLRDFIDTYLDVQEVMQGQSKDKIFDTAYSMHLKIMARIEANGHIKTHPKNVANK